MQTPSNYFTTGNLLLCLVKLHCYRQPVCVKFTFSHISQFYVIFMTIEIFISKCFVTGDLFSGLVSIQSNYA